MKDSVIAVQETTFCDPNPTGWSVDSAANFAAERCHNTQLGSGQSGEGYTESKRVMEIRLVRAEEQTQSTYLL